jgi:tryptophan synthase alpha chain
MATALPLAVGFGLSRPEHLAAVAPHAEAAIVGSAIMRLIEQQQNAPDLAEQLAAFAAHLKSGFAAAAADSPE